MQNNVLKLAWYVHTFDGWSRREPVCFEPSEVCVCSWQKYRKVRNCNNPFLIQLSQQLSSWPCPMIEYSRCGAMLKCGSSIFYKPCQCVCQTTASCPSSHQPTRIRKETLESEGPLQRKLNFRFRTVGVAKVNASLDLTFQGHQRVNWLRRPIRTLSIPISRLLTWFLYSTPLPRYSASQISVGDLDLSGSPKVKFSNYLGKSMFNFIMVFCWYQLPIWHHLRDIQLPRFWVMTFHFLETRSVISHYAFLSFNGKNISTK